MSYMLGHCTWTWPKLRHLELYGDGFDEFLSINRLLARHPSIEVISFDLSLHPYDLPSAWLPNLRALECNGNTAAFILSHSTSDSFRTLRVHGDWASAILFGRLLESLKNHAKVEHFIFMSYSIRMDEIRDVIKALPNLRTLNGCICGGDVQSLSVPRIPISPTVFLICLSG